MELNNASIISLLAEGIYSRLHYVRYGIVYMQPTSLHQLLARLDVYFWSLRFTRPPASDLGQGTSSSARLRHPLPESYHQISFQLDPLFFRACLGREATRTIRPTCRQMVSPWHSMGMALPFCPSRPLAVSLFSSKGHDRQDCISFHNQNPSILIFTHEPRAARHFFKTREHRSALDAGQKSRSAMQKCV